jgi:hypothetical protein
MHGAQCVQVLWPLRSGFNMLRGDAFDEERLFRVKHGSEEMRAFSIDPHVLERRGKVLHAHLCLDRDAVHALEKQSTRGVIALVVAGMNDVLNSQGYTQAGWWNRVPAPAWTLLITIAIFCNFLVGRGASRKSTLRFLILPVVLSISLFLIADIVRVNPLSLLRSYIWR